MQEQSKEYLAHHFEHKVDDNLLTSSAHLSFFSASQTKPPRGSTSKSVARVVRFPPAGIVAASTFVS